MKIVSAACLAVLLATALYRHVSAEGKSCENLATLALPDTTIKAAASVSAGPFTPPGPAPSAPSFPPGAAPSADPLMLPAFCRVVAITTPAVRFEVWLPLQQQWNKKFHGVGNGGAAGVIPYAAMAKALTRGYATAGTDTGHVNNPEIPSDWTWALGHPELVADYGHRGVHVTTVNAKAIARAFYDQAPRHSYFVGCSGAGRQGLMEAQRYPDDYDGIIAGDPANNFTRHYAGCHLWSALATLKDPESYIPPDKVPVLGAAVNAACDRLDGIADGVLDDPRACRFDPAVLTCQPGQEASACFTSKQVTAINAIWSGAHNSKGELIYPGLVPGGEAGSGGWRSSMTGTAPFTSGHWFAADGFFKYLVFENPHWDFRTFNYDADLPRALEKVGRLLDATDPDLRPFITRGGKLIMYHGWSDPGNSPLNSIAYYEQVDAFLRGHTPAVTQTPDFFRLFMVPGMWHCTGGPGPNSFDALGALEQWVEQGAAPGQIIATHVTNGVADRTRPLCPYPQVARYTGTGSTDDASNFVCNEPRH